MAQTDCRFYDLSRRGKVAMSGADSVPLLHKFCTNDVLNLPVGGGCEAFVLDAKGQIQFYVIAHRRSDDLLLEFPADATLPDVAARFVKYLGRYVIVEKVAFADRTAGLGELFVAGADAIGTIGKALEVAAPAEALQAVDCPKLGAGAWLARSVQAPLPNFTLFASTDQIEQAKILLTEAGAKARDSAWYEALRIEARFPLLGRDILEKALPQEIDRNAQTLNFRKGCYLGQETVARLDAMGHVNKTIVLLEGVPGSDSSGAATFDPGIGPELRAGEAVVGRVTSYAAMCDGRRGALATVRTSHNKPGTRLESDAGVWQVVV